MLVIFDWDGTLINSTDKIVASMQQAAIDLCVEPQSHFAIEQIIGLSLPKAVETLYPMLDELTCDQIQVGYSRVFKEKDQTPCDFFPGVEDCLENLKLSGCKIAVATGKSRQGLNRVLDRLNWQEVFHSTRCADETASKPDPLMLKQLMSELNVTRERTIMVGDTEFDLGMAVNANIRSVGVSYGAHSVEQLTKYQPVSIIDRMSELPALLGLSE